jgi:hypothetical protein
VRCVLLELGFTEVGSSAVCLLIIFVGAGVRDEVLQPSTEEEIVQASNAQIERMRIRIAWLDLGILSFDWL